jgi:protocatechuate 3,4-dioxygenase beta subunit
MIRDVSPYNREFLARRAVLAWMGAAATAAFVAACGGGSKKTATPTTTSTTATSSTTTSAAAQPGSTATTTARGSVTPGSCVLAPEQTEGPYYIAGEPNRRDITEGRPGLPLRLDLKVVRAANCAAVPGSTVEIWHADAGGDYSGFGGGASSRTFLRGQQTADGDGKVTFNTIYPGWYQGRAVHIHVKVHNGGRTVHTGQLYFDDSASQAVYSQAPYNSRSGQFLRNSQDGIYGSGGARSTVQVSQDGSGYVGTLTVGIAQ